MKISVIILNYNGKKDTLECLESLTKYQISNIKYQIVVVDNGSTDDDVVVIRKKFPKVKIIENKENLGFAEGNNVGIRYTLEDDYDYILLLNNDTLVEKNLLAQLIKVIKSNKKIGLVSPKIYFAPGYEFHKDRYKKNEKGKVIWYAGGIIDWDNILVSHLGVDEVDKRQHGRVEETDFATGCCMLVRKEVFEKIDLFDKKYFLYWEDVDLCLRAKKAGFKIFYVPQAILWHKNASASGGAGGNLSVYYQTRNRMLFALKFAPLKSKIHVLKQGLKYLFSGNFWQKKAVKDFFLLHFGKIKE